MKFSIDEDQSAVICLPRMFFAFTLRSFSWYSPVESLNSFNKILMHITEILAHIPQQYADVLVWGYFADHFGK